MKLTGKPTPEQIARLMENPVDPDEKIRGRLRKELHRLVNHAALFGVEIPAPLPTEEEQIRACQGVMPYRFRKAWADVKTSSEGHNPYGELRQHGLGGSWRGD